MISHAQRRFNILDVLCLVAFTAVGFAWCAPFARRIPTSGFALGFLHGLVLLCGNLLPRLLILWTPAFLINLAEET